MKRITILLTFMLMVLAACGNGEDPTTLEVTIAFDTMSGEPLDEITVTLPDESITLPEPVREGYVFDDWYLSAAFIETFDPAEVTTATEITLYAAWSEEDAETFTISFDTGGADPIDAITVDSGETIDAPTEPNWDDYAFAGWYDDAAFTTPFDYSAAITEDTTVYVRWLERFTVTFMVEGSLLDTVDVLEGQPLTLPAEPSKDGYTFTGWTTDEQGENDLESPHVVMANLELHAQFETIDYTINFETFDADPIPDLTESYGALISAPEPTAPDGYVFAGWYEDDAFTTLFTFDTMPLGDKTAYARWIEEGALNTVTFFVDGAIYDEQMITDGENATLPADPEKTGHDFVGWELYGDPFDVHEPVETHLTIEAVFEPIDYTITFEDDVAPIITAPYGSLISEPEEPHRDEHTFAGWYTDETFNDPFLFDTMPFEGAHLYARFIDENAPMSILDVILTMPEEATFADLTLIYAEHLNHPEMDTVLSLLTDGEHVIYAMVDFDVPVGSVISFKAGIHAMDDYPVIATFEALEDHGLDADFAFDPAAVSLEELRDLELTPLTIGTAYEITGFLMNERGTVAFFDPAAERFYPLFNVMMSDLHDAAFDDLEHYYVRLVALPMAPFEPGAIFMLYLEDALPVESVDLAPLEKHQLLETLLKEIYSTHPVHPFTGLETPPTDPFFGFGIEFEATGPNAHLYDADADEFAWVNEATTIDFDVRFTGETITNYEFSLEITLTPENIVKLSEAFTEEMGTIDVVVIAKSDAHIFVQDDTGIMTIYAGDPSPYTIGERYIIDLGFSPNGPMVSGVGPVIRHELGAASIDDTATAMSLSDLPALTETLHTGFFTELDGILLPGDGMYPFMLYSKDAVVYIHIDHRTYDDLAAYLYTNRVSIPGILSNFTSVPYNPEGVPGYVLYFDGDLDTLTTEPLDNTEIFDLVEHWLSNIKMPFRPYDTLELPREFDEYDLSVSYAFAEALITVEETSDARILTFDEAGTTTVSVTLTRGGDTHTFAFDVVVETYDLSSIAYAQSLPEGTTVTLRVDVAGSMLGGQLVLSDETGAILFDANTIPEWFNVGDTIIIEGELYETDGIDWLENATFNVYARGEVAEKPAITVLDPVTAFDTSDIAGLTYVEITGYLAYYNGNLSLLEEEGSDTVYILGLEGGYAGLSPFVGETVTLRGFMLDDAFFGPKLIYAERVITEFTGTIAELYLEDDGRRTLMDVYTLTYFDGIFYLMDTTGVIELRGISESWALNRIGEQVTVYATLVQEENATYLEGHGFYLFLNRTLIDMAPYTPSATDQTVSEVFEIDAETKTAVRDLYRVTGTVIDVEGELFIEDGDKRLRIADPLDAYTTWADDIDTVQSLTLLMTRNTTTDGEPVLIYLPVQTD